MTAALPHLGRLARPRMRQGVWTGLLAGLAALALYAGTAARGVEWQDSAIHQFRIVSGQLEHPLGLALSHPLHYWLGRAALWLPIGEPALRTNLLSALGGAAAVGLLAATVFRLTGRAAAAGLAAAVLAVAHSFWQLSAMTETYTLAAALMTLEWLLLLHYARTGRPAYLVLVFAVNGLHVADHLLGLLTLATYGALALERMVRGRLRWPWLAACGLAWLVTCSPYWTLCAAYYARTGDLALTLRSAFFGGGPGHQGWSAAVLNRRITAGQLLNAGLVLGYNFPSLALPVACWGLFQRVRGRRRLFHYVLVGQTVLIAAFVFRYAIADLYTYFVPVCAIVALWFGLGAARILDQRATARGRRAAVMLLALNAVLPPAVYATFPVLARDRGLLGGRLRDLPFRDEYEAFFRPWRAGDHSAGEFARAALAAAGPGGWLLGDGTTAYPAAYTDRVHGGPGGVRIYSGRQCLNLPGRPGLSDEELAIFLRAGGHAAVVPGPLQRLNWGGGFILDETAGLFWEIRPRGAIQPESDRVNSTMSRDEGSGASRP